MSRYYINRSDAPDTTNRVSLIGHLDDDHIVNEIQSLREERRIIVGNNKDAAVEYFRRNPNIAVNEIQSLRAERRIIVDTNQDAVVEYLRRNPNIAYNLFVGRHNEKVERFKEKFKVEGDLDGLLQDFNRLALKDENNQHVSYIN